MTTTHREPITRNPTLQAARVAVAAPTRLAVLSLRAPGRLGRLIEYFAEEAAKRCRVTATPSDDLRQHSVEADPLFRGLRTNYARAHRGLWGAVVAPGLSARGTWAGASSAASTCAQVLAQAQRCGWEVDPGAPLTRTGGTICASLSKHVNGTDLFGVVSASRSGEFRIRVLVAG
jgi:hypothetical protein